MTELKNRETFRTRERETESERWREKKRETATHTHVKDLSTVGLNLKVFSSGHVRSHGGRENEKQERTSQQRARRMK